MVEEEVRCVACVPDWGEDFVEDLLKIAVKKFYIPSGSSVFELDGVSAGPTK